MVSDKSRNIHRSDGRGGEYGPLEPFPWIRRCNRTSRSILFLFLSDLEMLVAHNGRLSFSSGLYARKTVSVLGVDTLNIITVLHLFKWDSLTVVVRSDSSFEVLEESTFSVVMHGMFMRGTHKCLFGRARAGLI